MVELIQAPESLFWYWIAERHSIYLKRLAGQSKPWTVDPILQTYKFTNPFRENDRGTVWLREHFLTPHRDDDLGLIAFNICWYRMFNWIGTGELLGWITEWDEQKTYETLTTAMAMGDQIFTGAHMVRSAFGRPKIEHIVEVCTDLWRVCKGDVAVPVPLPTVARSTQSLETVFRLLCTVPYVGPFLAYEMVTDMRHTRLLEDASDIMTWANPGPGAQRGLQRLGLPWKPDGAAIEAMRFLLSHHFDGLCEAGAEFSNPNWPCLEMRDIEHSLCEFDKYCRAKFGEGRPRSKYPGAA